MRFVNDAKIMLIGFALAQGVPLLASPLLTRLFSPEAFGLQSLFIGSATVLGVLATLRLDLAVVLAKDRLEAGHIAALAGLQTGIVTALVIGAITLFAPCFAAATGHPGNTDWIWALVPMVVGMAVVQISSGTLTWFRRFGPTSLAQVLNQFSYLGVAISLGFLWASPSEGLVIAKVIGQALSALSLSFPLWTFYRGIRLPPRAYWAELWTRCRPFLLFNTPYGLVGAMGREVPIFAFSAVAATATAGYYGLARLFLGVPAALLSASLSQVFYREAAEHRGSERLQNLAVVLLRLTMMATAPAFAFVMVWGDAAFSLAFGETWRTAGLYAMILSFAAWMGVQTAWPERLYESAGRQGLSFVIQVTFDAVAGIVVFASVLSGLPHIVSVALFAMVNSVFHLSYLVGMFRVAEFPLGRLFGTLSRGVAVLLVSIMLMTVLRFSGLPEVIGLICAAGVAMTACAWFGLRGYVHLKAAGIDESDAGSVI